MPKISMSKDEVIQQVILRSQAAAQAGDILSSNHYLLIAINLRVGNLVHKCQDVTSLQPTIH